MKKLFIPFLLCLSIIQLYAQDSDLILYSENGERFVVVLNGIQQNANYETNVKVGELNAPSYRVKIIFENQQLGEVNKTLYFNSPLTQYTYAVINKNGDYKVRYRNEVGIAQAPPPPPAQYACNYSPTPVTVVQTTTTTTTTNSGNGMGDNVSMNMSLGGVGMNININDNYGNSSTTTTQSTQVTTQYTSANQHQGHNHAEPVYDDGGCHYGMADHDFQAAKGSINAKTFEDSKFTVAKQITQSNCLTARQVKEIMQIFTYEDTKLDYAKFAYNYTHDKQNYFQVNDVFAYESSIDELNDFLGIR